MGRQQERAEPSPDSRFRPGQGPRQPCKDRFLPWSLLNPFRGQIHRQFGSCSDRPGLALFSLEKGAGVWGGGDPPMSWPLCSVEASPTPSPRAAHAFAAAQGGTEATNVILGVGAPEIVLRK